MSGLKLGDVILDSRRVIALPSLQALVFADLHDALGIAIASGLRRVVQNVDSIIAEYNPKTLIFMGPIEKEAILTFMIRRWGKEREFHFITEKSSSLSTDLKQLLELWGASLHQELVWGGYRFVEKLERTQGIHPLKLKLLNIVARPSLYLKIGGLWGGSKVPVFLKGFGRIYMPNMNPKAHTETIFKEDYRRCDLFAIGKHRVLPLGKVGNLRSLRNRIAGLPAEVLSPTKTVFDPSPEV